MSWVVVIPKEGGFAWPRPPFLWYDTDFFRIFFLKKNFDFEIFSNTDAGVTDVGIDTVLTDVEKIDEFTDDIDTAVAWLKQNPKVVAAIQKAVAGNFIHRSFSTFSFNFTDCIDLATSVLKFWGNGSVMLLDPWMSP